MPSCSDVAMYAIFGESARLARGRRSSVADRGSMVVYYSRALAYIYRKISHREAATGDTVTHLYSSAERLGDLYRP